MLDIRFALIAGWALGCQAAPLPDPGDDEPVPSRSPATGSVSTTDFTNTDAALQCQALTAAAAVGGPLSSLGIAADGGLVAGGTLGEDAVVRRQALNGSLAWSRHLAGDVDVGAIAGTSDGGVVVGGSFRGRATIAAGEADAVVFDSAGGEDGYLARFDAAGGLRWAVQHGGTAADHVLDLAVLSGDEVVVVGDHQPDVTWGGFVARFDGDGRLVWLDETGTGSVSDVALDPTTGEVLVAGTVLEPTELPGTPPLELQPSHGFEYLARWSASGGARAVTTFGGATEDLDVADDGTVLVAGSFWMDSVFGAGEAGETILVPIDDGREGFAAAFAPDLSLRWATQTLTQPSYTAAHGRGITASEDGGAVWVGDFSHQVMLGAGEAAQTRLVGRDDAFVARLDASGRLVCAEHLTGSGVDGIEAVVRIPGGLVVAGPFGPEPLTLVPDTELQTELTSAGERDGFFATFAL